MRPVSLAVFIREVATVDPCEKRAVDREQGLEQVLEYISVDLVVHVVVHVVLRTAIKRDVHATLRRAAFCQTR